MKELQPRYDLAESFYDKAKIEMEGATLSLYSYGTKVAYITNYGSVQIFKIFDFHSATTLRHIKEFYRQFVNPLDEEVTKKDLEKYLTKEARW